MKENQEPFRCFCGGPAAVVKNRRGWGVGCLHCREGVFGYRSELDAVQAWAEEVIRRGREARKGN